MDGPSFVDALAKRLRCLSLSRRQTFPLAAALLAGIDAARPATAQDRGACAFLGAGCATAEDCCGGTSDGAICQPTSQSQRRPAGSATPRKHGHHGGHGGHGGHHGGGHHGGGNNTGTCACGPGFTPCQHATANCCGGPFPVCCPPHSAAFCCPADFPLCCDSTAASLTCCSSDFSVCCPAGSSAGCCSSEFSHCCPPGAAFDCCPSGTECSPDGCLSLATATRQRRVIAGAAGGGRRGGGR
jgi:hypothetical protein